jgi:MFS family permease
MTATFATAFSWNIWSFMFFRLLTGAGIGGEYSAINSTIQELVPARVRGWTDLIINGSFWVGAAIGAAASIILLSPSVLPVDVGWRAAFLIGAALSVIIFILRLWIPESPRWLITHGRATEGEAIVANIEASLARAGHPLACGPYPKVRLHARTHTPLREVMATLFLAHRTRTAVGLSLMTAQAFFLQRDLLHLRAGPDRLLPGSVRQRWLVPPAICCRQFPWSPTARAVVRYDWSPADDHVYLHDLRYPSGSDGFLVCA